MIKFKPASLLNKRRNSFLKSVESGSQVLEGKRVTLIPPRLGDFASWKKVRARNQDFLMPYEPLWAEDSLTKKFFIRRLKRQADEVINGRGAFFLIHDNGSGDIIGGINMNDIRYGAQRCANLGYWLDQNHQGQGYMQEAAQIIIDYAFNNLKLRRLNAACLIDNDRSIKLLASLGFDEEGYAKKYLQINGIWQDHRLFGLCLDYSKLRSS